MSSREFVDCECHLALVDPPRAVLSQETCTRYITSEIRYRIAWQIHLPRPEDTEALDSIQVDSSLFPFIQALCLLVVVETLARRIKWVRISLRIIRISLELIQISETETLRVKTDTCICKNNIHQERRAVMAVDIPCLHT